MTKIKRLDHIGIAVKNLDEAIERFTRILGAEFIARKEIVLSGSKMCVGYLRLGDTIIGWEKSMRAEAAGQMQHLKKLMLSRPYFTRIGDPTVVTSARGTNYTDIVYATRDAQGSYAMVYLPQNKPVKVNLGKISGRTKNIWWFDPRTGQAIRGKAASGSGTRSFSPPREGKDWVLVIDDASKGFSEPGKQ